jgi:hypothetical protein
MGTIDVTTDLRYGLAMHIKAVILIQHSHETRPHTIIPQPGSTEEQPLV